MAKRPTVRSAVRILLLLGALTLAGLALADRWSGVSSDLSKLQPGDLIAASVLGVLAVGAAMMSWRALLRDLGSPLPMTSSARIVFLSQLGKYIPGSVWAYLAQVELGKEHEVPRRRSAAVSVLAVMISLATGLTLAAATMPWASPSAARRFWPVFLVIPPLILALHPSVLNRLLNRVLRILKRPPVDEQLHWRGMLLAVGWSGIAAILSGVQIWLLSTDIARVGADTLAICIGAYALAWCAGFLFVIAPAGAGVREAAIVAALAPVMSTSAALAVALLSRLLTTGADLVAAGAALMLRGRHPAAAGPVPDVARHSEELPDPR